MPLNNPSYRAGGDISPSRFVKFTTGAGSAADFVIVAAAGATFPMMGISQDGSKFPHTSDGWGSGASAVAAESGDQISIYGLGDVCLLEVDNSGNGILAGSLLSSDANGKGILSTGAAGNYFVGAIALERPPVSATALIKVQVVIFEHTAA